MSDTSGLAVEIRPVDDFARFGDFWRDLEQRADGSFFQSWAWTGCLAEERFTEPWSLSARRGERIVALALFNRGPRPSWRKTRPLLLGEAGSAGRDSIFIEHNGLLIDSAESPESASACWRALDQSQELRRVRWILSGVPSGAEAALPPTRMCRVTVQRMAPYLDFTKLSNAADDLLACFSANTRQQLRRSLRLWETRGPLRLEIAKDAAEADAFLDGLKALHQSYWIGRGKPGAFAEPFFERFHRALLHRAGEGQRLDLIRVSAGDATIGYLYNLVQGDWVAAYQSGFDFGEDGDKLRPGLICHLLAIQHYRREGKRIYDFLGGDARYKRSFANAERELLWLEARARFL